MSEFNVGDSVWWASPEMREAREPCPVCFGKLKVTVILGNDEQVETDCDYCGRGSEGPKGYITWREWTPDVKQIVLQGKEVNEHDDIKEISYRWAQYVVDQKDVFSSEEQANIRMQERIKEREEAERVRMERGKVNVAKSYAWHVGYHKKEKKRAEKQVEYHGKKVVAMQKLKRVETHDGTK